MQPLDYIKERLHFSYGTQMGLKLFYIMLSARRSAILSFDLSASTRLLKQLP